MDVRIYLTGRMGAEVDGEPVIRESQLRERQVRLAFAYLFSRRDRPVPRDELAGVFWPEEMAPTWEAGCSSLMGRVRGVLSAQRLQSRGLSLAWMGEENRLTVGHGGKYPTNL